jgi:TonB-linked SusC/RagA family outer membrane protein
MNKSLLTIFVLLLASLSAIAQQRTISGMVTDVENGDPLIGANVIIKGTTNGTVTDFDGKYSLSANPGDVLVFTYVGFTRQEIKVDNQSVIDVTMSEGTLLNEMVVTALGISREKKALGYAVQEVDGDELNKHNQSNIVNSLSGKIAGVQVQGTGNLGGSSRIVIRGAGSISGNNQPLFVVDGIPIDNSNYASFTQAYGDRDDNFGNVDYGNAAQDINPNDIESVSVLKGANAAALYGSRAANGVILITTKKGKAGENLKVDVNLGATFETAFDFMELQNEYGGGQSQEFSIGADGIPEMDITTDESWGPRLDGTMVRQWDGVGGGGEVRPWIAHPNNYEDFFETGVTTNANFSIGGSNNNSTYRLSYTRFDQAGIVPNSRLERNLIGINLGTKWKKFDVNVSGNYMAANAKGRPSTGGSSDNLTYNLVIWTQRQLDLERLRTYKNDDGSQRTWRTSGFDQTDVRANNPFWLAFEDVQDDNKDRMYGNISVKYNITDNLSIQGRIGQDWYEDHRRDRRAVGSRYTPFFITDDLTFREVNSDVLVNFTPRVSDDFSIDLSAGAAILKRNRTRLRQATQGGLTLADVYSIANSVDRPLTAYNPSRKEIQSVYGVASFGYKNTVYLDVTGRNDWSSTLPADNRSYFYPSVTSSIVFSELLGQNDILSFGKLRLGWAQVGNDTDPYGINYTYDQGQAVGGNPTFNVPSSLPNPDLKPELTTSVEVGVDMRFLKNRFGVDLTYYTATTKDQIFNIQTTSTTGFSTRGINAGEVKNNGIELALDLDVVRSKDFNWNISFNWAKNNNELVSLTDDLDNILVTTFYASGVARVFYEHRVGEPMFSVYSTKIARDAQGRALIQDESGSNPGAYVSADTAAFFGSILPNWTAGITNSISYKGIQLGFLIDMQDGGVYYGRGYQTALYAGTLLETIADNQREVGVVLEGVYEDGTPNTINLDSQTYNRLKRRTPGDHTTFDASFVKLREVSLGYNLPGSIVDKTPFSRVGITIVGRNLAFLHRNTPKGYDPESVGNASGNIQGREYGAFPTARSIGINLNIGF